MIYVQRSKNSTIMECGGFDSTEILSVRFWQHKKDFSHSVRRKLCSAHFLHAKKTRKHIRCVLCSQYHPSSSGSRLLLAHPSEEKSIKVFRMRAERISTQRKCSFRSISDVSGPSASEFLIFAFSSFLMDPHFPHAFCTQSRTA